MDDTSSPASTPLPPPPPPPPPPNRRVKFNVGGTIFETTTSTLSTAPTSLLTTLSTTHNQHHHPIFIDNDPSIFPSLLSLLRTNHLPSSTYHNNHHLLHHYSHLYNLNPLLSQSLTPPPFLPFDSSHRHTLPFHHHISALSISSNHHTLLLSHSHNLISSYHLPALTPFHPTFATHLPHISSLRQISPTIAALGSDSSRGLHFYSLPTGKHSGQALWSDPSDLRTHQAHVTAIDFDGGNSVFASFECQHRENAVLVVDTTTSKVVAEFGRQTGNAAKSMAVRKLDWVPGLGVLVGCSVTCGAFGYSGHIRVWDPRAGGGEVWETSEPGGFSRISRVGDCMADVDVDTEGLFLAKVGSKSGDLGVADMRKLGPDPWVYLEDPNPGLGVVGPCGRDVVVHCYNKHVFVGREGGLEAWSTVSGKEVSEEDVMGGDERQWSVYRRNYMDKDEDAKRGVISKIHGGGNRLFVCRDNVEGVEVWESSKSSGVKMVV